MAENRPVRRKRYVDYTLLVIVFFLLAFGLVMVYSTSSYSASLDFEGPIIYQNENNLTIKYNDYEKDFILYGCIPVLVLGRMQQ